MKPMDEITKEKPYGGRTRDEQEGTGHGRGKVLWKMGECQRHAI